MIRIIITVVLLTQLLFHYGCKPSVTTNNAELKFTIKEFDFGELNMDDEATFFCEFTNTGNTPLIIHNVKTSCGCTVPNWPQKPIKPGKNGKISINYDTSHPGMFSKTITVFYNGQDSPEILTIKGNIRLSPKSEP